MDLIPVDLGSPHIICVVRVRAQIHVPVMLNRQNSLHRKKKYCYLWLGVDLQILKSGHQRMKSQQTVKKQTVLLKSVRVATLNTRIARLFVECIFRTPTRLFDAPKSSVRLM